MDIKGMYEMITKFLIIKNPTELWVACPCAWKAETADAKSVYIHFRYGKLDILIDNQPYYTSQVGGPNDGYIKFENICRIANLAVTY